jgi:glycosyltransferase involved in cell wall biosynthesis
LRRSVGEELSPGGVAADADLGTEEQLGVDIVVDNFNYGRFLADAVDSALAQTHERVNVIVVDDGSTDDSREVLKRYEGRVEVVLKENGGQASALNAGAARATGDIVMFLDADDVLLPGAAALVAAAFAASPRAAKVQYRLEVIDEQGDPTGATKPPAHLPLPGGDVTREELTFPFDLVWLPTSACAFRATALRRILPIPEVPFANCADWYLVHLTSLLGEVVSLQQLGARYRVHGGNSYERAGSALDLGHVRQAVVYSAATTAALERLAGELGLALPYARILSVADLANRLVSKKLEPALHPLPGDRVPALALDGMRAALRRFDVAWPMKLLYVGWLAGLAAAPTGLARELAAFLLPERRETVNPFLRTLHRRNRVGRGAERVSR